MARNNVFQRPANEPTSEAEKAAPPGETKNVQETETGFVQQPELHQSEGKNIAPKRLKNEGNIRWVAF